MKKNIKPPSDWYLAEMENNNSLNLKNRRKKLIILRWLAVTSHHSIMPVLAHDTQRSPQPEASPRVFLERQGPNGGTRANPWMHVENHISDWIDCIIPFSFTRCYANSNVFGWTSCPSGRQHDASLGCIQGRRHQTSKATSHKASEKGSDRMDWGPPPSPRHPKIQANFIPSNIIEGRSKALTDVPWFSQWKTIFRAFLLGWMMHRCSQVSTMHANKTCNTSRAHLRRNAWASHFELLHFHTFLRELAWNVLPAGPDQTWPPYHIAMDLAEYD